MRLGLLLSGLVLALSVPAVADEYAPVRDKLELCVGCHGEKGASTDPQYPILAGQHFYYLYVQMKDFKSGARKNEIMSPLSLNLEKAEMQTIAKYFSEQKWPRLGFRADPARSRLGETAAAAGQCVQCHRGGYEGDSRIPRLAGQHPQYLKKTMLDFKHKGRTNSAAKSSLMGSFTDSDIAAMADFMGEM